MGRFLNADDTDYLNASGTTLGCNLYAYNVSTLTVLGCNAGEYGNMNSIAGKLAYQCFAFGLICADGLVASIANTYKKAPQYYIAGNGKNKGFYLYWLKYGRNNSQNLSKKQKYFTIMDFLKLSGVI